MRKVFPFLFFLFGTSLIVFSQDNNPLSNAQFALIKNAVWFYSKDLQTFKNPSTCKESADYPQLIECSKGMQGVSEKIKKWQNHSVTLIEDLNNLQSLIDKDITSKGNRKNLPEYTVFKNQATKIISEAEKISNTDNDTKNANPKNDSQKVKKNVPENSPDQDKAVAEKNSESGFNFWILIPIFLSLIALGYTWLTNKFLKQDLSDLKRQRKTSDDLDNSKLSQQINTLEKSVRSFDGTIEELKDQFNKKIRKILSEQPPNGYQPSGSTEPIKDVKPLSNSRFAKYADMGDGFSINQLSEEQDSEKIFEILMIGNNNAKFKVVANRDAQLLALSNPNLYLNKTCKYDTVPTVSSKIITEDEGDLRLQGNKWVIINPTKISFV